MATDIRLKEELPAITDQLVETYTECSRLNHLGHEPLPSRDAVAEIVADLFEVLYPGYGKRQNLHIGNIEYYVGSLVDALHDKLTKQIARALRHELCEESPHVDCEKMAQPKAVELLRRLPEVRKTLEQDVEAAFRGDPAAAQPSRNHLLLSRPRSDHGLSRRPRASRSRRAVHSAHDDRIRPREDRHRHPPRRDASAPASSSTTAPASSSARRRDIGDGVKLYQGVTLGALSFPKDDGRRHSSGGNKRHPTLEDDVVVYANATILGGQTVIGERAVIGSNVWLTESVPPDTTVVLEKPKLRLKGAQPKNEPLTYEI